MNLCCLLKPTLPLLCTDMTSVKCRHVLWVV